MDKDVRKKLIDRYKDGYRVVADAVSGAPDDELDTSPARVALAWVQQQPGVTSTSPVAGT